MVFALGTPLQNVTPLGSITSRSTIFNGSVDGAVYRGTTTKTSGIHIIFSTSLYSNVLQSLNTPQKCPKNK